MGSVEIPLFHYTCRNEINGAQRAFLEEKIKIKECIRCCVWGKGYLIRDLVTPRIPIELVRPPLQMPQTPVGLGHPLCMRGLQ